MLNITQILERCMKKSFLIEHDKPNHLSKSSPKIVDNKSELLFQFQVLSSKLKVL